MQPPFDGQEPGWTQMGQEQQTPQRGMQLPLGGEEPGWTQMGTQQQMPSQGIPTPPSRQGAYFSEPAQPEQGGRYFSQPPQQAQPGQYFGYDTRGGNAKQSYEQPPWQDAGMPPSPPSFPSQMPQGYEPEEGMDRRKTVRHVLEQDARGGTVPSAAPRRRVKKSVYAVAALLVLAAAAAVVLLLSSRGTNFGYITRGTLNASYSGDALIVRNEVMYTQDGITRIDYTAAEAQSVQRGDKVCTVYSSGFSAKELTTLEKYRTQIKEYHKTLLSSENVADQKLNSLESIVQARAVEAQALVQGAQGNLINQEVLLTEAMQNRMLYLKQKYPDDQKLTRLYEDENSQAQRISSWTKQYAANTSGMVSFYTDGFEPVLNMNTWLDFEPTEVRSMYRGNIPENPASGKNTVPVYRLVSPDSWSVLMLSDDRNWTPVMGRTYQLLIESFDNTVVNATVVSFTLSGGELLIRLRVEAPADSIENVLYIRSCQVHLGESVDTLSVPESALYEQDGLVGVVILPQGMGGEYFVPVAVISRDSGLAHIVPSISGVLQEGMPVRLW